TRVFRDVARLGCALEKLDGVVGQYSNSKVAVICDWENIWATKHFCGFNNVNRNYIAECVKWYKPFYEKGISVDIIPMDGDFAKYDLVIAPFLYMLKDGTIEKIEKYVADGGNFVSTYLSGLVDKNDMCYLGGFPAGRLKDVFGIWNEETDSLPEGMKNGASYNGKIYDVVHVCDIIHSNGAKILGEYQSDFYAGMPAITENKFGNGTAYYVAFRNDDCFADDFCNKLIDEIGINTDCGIKPSNGVFIRKRGNSIFVMNFSESEAVVTLDKEYKNTLTDEIMSGEIKLPVCGYIVVE
ncbi:MAG: beta-galactosidase trimerization domain-containing protein, partial [Acutalibacteraceae bacterium]|nr:beta-galactosidase trimerization domain-containing protein [Acutalibacteraceae bacterium]